MLSLRFIPESVFYTQSVVRSPCFILTGPEGVFWRKENFKAWSK